MSYKTALQGDMGVRRSLLNMSLTTKLIQIPQANTKKQEETHIQSDLKAKGSKLCHSIPNLDIH